MLAHISQGGKSTAWRTCFRLVFLGARCGDPPWGFSHESQFQPVPLKKENIQTVPFIAHSQNKANSLVRPLALLAPLLSQSSEQRLHGQLGPLSKRGLVP